MIDNYEKYLEIIDAKLQNYFAQQKPFIFCKESCSECCEHGEYPFSAIEISYAVKGFSSLSADKQKTIQANIQKIKSEKEQSNDEKFMYQCPFLIDKKCSIYNYRGLICRNHGLMFYNTNENGDTIYKMPNCAKTGLNYSNVYDEKTGTISLEKWKQTGIEEEPVSYNIGINFLLNNQTTKTLGINFGDQKALIDWF